MSESPGYGQRPQMQGAFRRSVTMPMRQLSVHEKAGLDSADANADILYSHSIARIVKFSPPTESIKSTSTADIPADTDYPVDTIETLPWRSRTETLAASGQMIIEKVRGSTNFLKCQTVMHALLRNSQCWCVDGESKFVLRIRKFQYYRIELPSTTEEDKAKVDELKKVLPTILRYERTPCPFIRAFTVELPDDAITPRRKGQWKRRDSSQLNTPDTDIATPPLRHTKPTRSWSLRSPPTAYPKSGPNYTFDDERGRTSDPSRLQRRGGPFENDRSNSPASYVASEDDNDSECLGSEHGSEADIWVNRSLSNSPRKHLEAAQEQRGKAESHPLSRKMDQQQSSNAHLLGEHGSLAPSQVHLVAGVEDQQRAHTEADLSKKEIDVSAQNRDSLQPSTAAKESIMLDGHSASPKLEGESNILGVESTAEVKHHDSAPKCRDSPPSPIQLPKRNVSQSVTSGTVEGIDLVTEEVMRQNNAKTSTVTAWVEAEPGIVSSRLPLTDNIAVSCQTTLTSNKPDHLVHSGSTGLPQAHDESLPKHGSKFELEHEPAIATRPIHDAREEHAKEVSYTEVLSSSENSPEILPGPLRDTDRDTAAEATASADHLIMVVDQLASGEKGETASVLEEPSATLAENADGPSPSTPVMKSAEFPSGLPPPPQILHENGIEIGADGNGDDDANSITSSIDSFHTMASPRRTLSRTMSSNIGLSQDTEYPKNILSQLQHKRDMSEITVIASNVSDPASMQSFEAAQEDMSLLQDHNESQSTIGLPSDQPTLSTEGEQGLRKRRQARRSFSPLPPPSTILSESSIHHDGENGHLTKVILQKLIIAPIEMASMIVHILARIAGGASLNDLLTGELFKRPEHGRRVSGFATQLNGGKSPSDTEDDYGVPVRGRRRSTDRRLAEVLYKEDEEVSDDLD